ncbi:carboxymuconolactone decarboxylase family protein [Paenibacillus sp. ACRRX]|uniref:carboxymuconolactone decarboxylase family protein n=1 Tax=Paenibacillus sp. ACRRX TaxID=2918206 RepID=UPI001EF736C5|nr:carboxymuconolactone decarboxylase family protein [Paenibacillus sp. ACRRX]MCG7408717.1 carboxymuconolactone decarboxylase family protein [Paenibacillus sp. ACRRX]
MTRRMKLNEVFPAGYQAMLGLEQAVQASGIDKKLLELVKIRSSQINGCAFCLDMHTKDARRLGETEQRLYTLSAWRDTPYFTPQERSLLALVESITRISEHHVQDDVYNEAAKYFTTDQLAALIMAAITINGWNRIAITTGMMPE